MTSWVGATGASCGGTVGVVGPFARRVLALLLWVAISSVAAGCSSTETNRASTTEAPDRSTTTTAAAATDPCALADRAEVDELLGGPSVVATSSSEMSGDGVGLVLNCVYAAQGDDSRAVGFVQREGFGRAGFEESRAATAEATSLGSAGYWVPSKQQALVLDGEDLVAVRFLGVEVDQATAERVLSDAVERRRVGAS